MDPNELLGAIVVLKTDPEQRGRIVTAYTVTLPGSVTYQLSMADAMPSWHYAQEFEPAPIPKPKAGFFR